MAVLEHLEPKPVFHYFEEIAGIPRPSYREKAVSDYLVAFAKARHLEVWQDALWNVVLVREASKGYENEEPLILQGHLDMVCEQDGTVNKDMNREGLDLAVGGDFVYAKGTTLGGDDGIAIAYMLALLDDETLKHPRLECVCTVSEEVGMEGAAQIDLSMLKGHRMINIDSENEGELLASCAGGGRADIALPADRSPFGGETVMIHIAGLSGGHSGTEIHKGHANAARLLVRILTEVSDKTEVRLVALSAGQKDNAIPREALVTVRVADVPLFKKTVETAADAIRLEYAAVEPMLTITIEEPTSLLDVSPDSDPLSPGSTRAVLALCAALPNGVVRMSDVLPGLVETSLNLGICELNRENLHLRYAVRSSVGTAYQALVEQMQLISTFFGAAFARSGEYPAWEYVADSPLREKMVRIYREMFQKELRVEAIHAGVECGLLAGKIPNLDAVSMGPDVLDIHTPQERMSISSVQRTYAYLRQVIEEPDADICTNIPKQHFRSKTIF